MKVFKYVLYATVLLLFLQGCNDEDQVSNIPENTPVEDNGARTNNTTNEQNDAIFPFTSFDLDIDYENGKEFDVDYENEHDGMEAEIKDTINDERLHGDEAFEKLKGIFQEMTFDQNTEKDAVISEVLRLFNMKEDYLEFELEVQFTDGTEKEYND